MPTHFASVYPDEWSPRAAKIYCDPIRGMLASSRKSGLLARADEAIE
jgi:hypothetical protein